MFFFLLLFTVVPFIYTHICDPKNVCDKREEQRWTTGSSRDQGGASSTLPGWYVILIYPDLLDLKFMYSTITCDVLCFVITDGSSSNLYAEAIDGNGAQSGGVKTGLQTLQSKDQECLRPASAGHNAPLMVPSVPSTSFPRPIYPGPLLSHVPMVRPHPQLHPNVVQRMLAHGIQPQQVGSALMQAGWYRLLPVISSTRFWVFLNY